MDAAKPISMPWRRSSCLATSRLAGTSAASSSPWRAPILRGERRVHVKAELLPEGPKDGVGADRVAVVLNSATHVHGEVDEQSFPLYEFNLELFVREPV